MLNAHLQEWIWSHAVPPGACIAGSMLPVALAGREWTDVSYMEGSVELARQGGHGCVETEGVPVTTPKPGGAAVPCFCFKAWWTPWSREGRLAVCSETLQMPRLPGEELSFLSLLPEWGCNVTRQSPAPAITPPLPAAMPSQPCWSIILWHKSFSLNYFHSCILTKRWECNRGGCWAYTLVNLEVEHRQMCPDFLGRWTVNSSLLCSSFPLVVSTLTQVLFRLCPPFS